MKKIDINLLSVKSFNHIEYAGKKIIAHFGGRIYFAYQNGELYYHKFSLLGRIAHACFGYKKSFGIQGLWNALKAKRMIANEPYIRSAASEKIIALFKSLDSKKQTPKKIPLTPSNLTNPGKTTSKTVVLRKKPLKSSIQLELIGVN